MIGIWRGWWALQVAGTRIWWNTLLRSTWRHRLSWTFLLVFLAVLAFFFAFGVGYVARLAGRIDPSAVDAIPGALLFGVFLFTFVTGFGISLSALYLSGDLELLMAAPIPIHSIFAAKLLQATIPSYLFVSLPMLPSLITFGLSQGYGWPYYVALPIVLFLLPLLPVGVGSVLVMAVVRWVPARRVAEILGLVTAAISIAFSLWGQGASARTFRGMGAVGLVNSVRSLDVPFTPPSLAGHALVDLGRGDVDAAARGLLIFAALSIASFLIALDVAAGLYYSGWAKMRVGAGRSQTSRTLRQATPWGRLLSHPVWAILVKDFQTIPRDLSNVVQVLSPLAFSVFWAWQLTRSPLRFSGDDMMGLVLPLMNVTIALGIASLIFSRFALTGISREGKAAWIIRAAPVSAWHWLGSKFLVAYLPFLVIGGGMSLALNALQGADWATQAQSVGLTLIVGAGVTGLTLGFGGANPKFDWTHPQQMVGMGLGCVSFVAYGAFTGFVVVVFMTARVLALRLPDIYSLIWVAALSLSLLVTAGVVFGPLAWAARRLNNLD